MADTEKLKSLAYRMKDLASLRSLFAELNYDFVDEPVNKQDWSEDEKNIVIESRIIAKKDDYLIYYIQTNTDSLKEWKGIASKIIKHRHGLCLVCSHNPSGFKWIFSSISKEFTKSFSETRHIPVEIRPESGVPKSFIEFLEKIEADNYNASTIAAKISEAFDNFTVQIHDELTINVFEALKTLSEGIILEESNKLELSNETLEKIREPIFILLYRIMFVLYAEDRGIFPIENKVYYDKFSLKWIKHEWLLKSDSQKKLKEYEVQQRLQNLFRLIELGSEDLGYKSEEFFMRSYYGRLFDRKIHHELEKWKIPNKQMLEAISLLTRTRDKKGNYFFLDYAALETRHLGSVYEHLLEYHLTVKGKKIADLPDPEQRKSTGSYYTPQYIVDYIVHNTIEPLIQQIVAETKDKSAQIEKILALNILDPAMGSGHFLIGVVNYIAKRICEIEEYEITEQHLNERKRDVVRRCVYGVDINPLAVDLAMVSLWLETLSSERPLSFLDAHLKCGNALIGYEINDIFNKQYTLVESEKGRNRFKKNIRDFFILENLEDDTANAVKTKIEKYDKIKSMGSIYYDLQFLLNMKLAKSFGFDIPPLGDFSTKIGEQSLDFYSMDFGPAVKSITEKIKPFHWEIEFPEVFYDENGIKRSNSGFDAIIGNPPYIKEYSNRNVFDELKKSGAKASEYYEGKMDYWYLFTCYGIDLLRKGGYQGFIATNNWPTSAGAKKLRNKILSEGKILKFIDFVDFKVFRKKASQQTMIYIMKKDNSEKEFVVQYSKAMSSLPLNDDSVCRFLYDGESNGNFVTFPVTIKRKKDTKIYFVTNEIEKIKDKIRHVGIHRLLKEDVAQGIVMPQDFVIKKHLDSLDKSIRLGDGIFNITSEEKKKLNLNATEEEIVKPFYTSNELHRFWGNSKNELWVLYTSTNVIKDMSRFPNIKKHLDKFAKIITSDFAPYGIHRARDERFFLGEKIISLRKTPFPRFTYTDFPCYVSQSYFVIKPTKFNIKYLVGLLNSKLVHFWLASEKKQGGNLQIDKAPLQSIPIVKPDKKTETKIITIVDQILQRKEKSLNSDISDLEREIDETIYSIYNLNENDIEILNEFIK